MKIRLLVEFTRYTDSYGDGHVFSDNGTITVEKTFDTNIPHTYNGIFYHSVPPVPYSMGSSRYEFRGVVKVLSQGSGVQTNKKPWEILPPKRGSKL